MSHDVSIVIPVLDKLDFTKQCLDRIWRNTGDTISYDVVVIDNASRDGTADWFADTARFPRQVRYLRNDANLGFAAANNAGARLSQSRHLVFLNNDTLVQPGWLSGMLGICRSDASVGIVGIKQLFPYTNTIYHTGIVFAPDGTPEHLYPHLDASLPHVNVQREYQAVTGACLLIDRTLFTECGGFDEAYRNGYEDIDLCLAVRQRGRKVVCCTSAYIYHYGQISAGRTKVEDRNAKLFANKWAGRLRADRDEYLLKDRVAGGSNDGGGPDKVRPALLRSISDDCFYLADELEQGSALTWINAEIALALQRRGVPVFVNGRAPLSSTLSASTRQTLARSTLEQAPAGGIQIKWSHYWPRHLNLELAGNVNLELFVINYLFGAPGSDPWDYWLQGLRQNRHEKLPLSAFCRSVLLQTGVPERECHVWHPGYSREIQEVDEGRRSTGFRFLTVTNSHDLERYNTQAIIDAYRQAFSRERDVTLVIKDYGASSGDTTIRRAVAQGQPGARIEYVDEFTGKRALIGLYKSSDAFVSAHRGEGFGMKILDAMACGLPVITPLFGGPADYCRPDNCFPVSFSQVPMGDCLDARSLRITNRPLWAEVDPHSLREQMRKVYDDSLAAKTIATEARAGVIESLSWDNAAARLLEITSGLRERRVSPPRSSPKVTALDDSASPYWLGLRVSVVIPTHNRKDTLLACLDALARQSILPQELEVLVVDDGSTDGTGPALELRSFPFTLRYFRQENAGPGSARNLGIELAAGEIVLFIGDDIIADDRLLEAHLIAHASAPDPGVAVLGRIDWPAGTPQTAVMQYVGDGSTAQFAYGLIPRLSALDHRFFYTSNISLKRRFLADAAAAGVGFDPSFRRAAFEDSEFAFRLIPRGLRIRYDENARAVHDHWMDLDGFARREFSAGEMAVVFYRKHPRQDDELQVRWIADLVEPAAALLAQPDFLRHLEAFDGQTDTLLRALAGSLELLVRNPQPGASVPIERLREALHGILRVVFDVERTRGKLQEWFSTVDDPAKVKAAQTLTSVMRKIEFLNLNAGDFGLPATTPAPDAQAVAGLSRRIEQLEGVMSTPAGHRLRRRPLGQAVRRFVATSSILPRLLTVDRYLQDRLQAASNPNWLASYRRMRRRIRERLL